MACMTTMSRPVKSHSRVNASSASQASDRGSELWRVSVAARRVDEAGDSEGRCLHARTVRRGTLRQP